MLLTVKDQRQKNIQPGNLDLTFNIYHFEVVLKVKIDSICADIWRWSTVSKFEQPAGRPCSCSLPRGSWCLEQNDSLFTTDELNSTSLKTALCE